MLEKMVAMSEQMNTIALANGIIYQAMWPSVFIIIIVCPSGEKREGEGNKEMAQWRRVERQRQS